MKLFLMVLTTCLLAAMAATSGCEPGQQPPRTSVDKSAVAPESPDANNTPKTNNTPDTLDLAARPLIGVWRIVGVGEKRLDDAGVEIFWTFSKDEYVVTDGFGIEFSRSRYEIDTTQTPFHITTKLIAVAGEPPDTPSTGKGIFAIDGDELRIRMEIDQPTRPTNFDEDLVVHLVRVAGPDL